MINEREAARGGSEVAEQRLTAGRREVRGEVGGGVSGVRGLLGEAPDLIRLLVV